jgi:uncharacterized protein involved in exopolysaccharide biosynthesis
MTEQDALFRASKEVTPSRPWLQSSGPTMRDLAAVIFRRSRLILYSFLAISLAILAYGMATPSYRAHMKFLVRRGRLDPLLAPTPTTPPQFDREQVSEEELNSEVEIIKDEDVLRRVVRETGLAGSSMNRPGPAGGDDEYDISRAVQRLAGKLEVKPIRRTNLITVEYASGDPRVAAHVLQSLSEAYMEKHLAVHRPAGESLFFEHQTALCRQRLEQSQLGLLTFIDNEGVVSADLQRDLTLQKLSDLYASDLQAQAQIAEIAKRTQILTEKLRVLPERTLDRVTHSDNPQLMDEMKSELLRLQLRRTELLTKFDPSYRLVQEVDQQVSQAQAALGGEQVDPIRSETTERNPSRDWAETELVKAEVDLQALQARHAANSSQLQKYQQAVLRLGGAQLRQQDLVRELKAAEDDYLLYVKKREEARIGDALDERGILNVTVAEPPLEPALPEHSRLAIAMIAVGLASITSTGLAFAADYLEPTFHTPDDVIAHLGAPVLASLPASDEDWDLRSDL